jgi:V/A-type H+/Na+-transporting ATPase subunit F
MSTASTIAIIGDEDAFGGFRALGVAVLVPGPERTPRAILEGLAPAEYGIVFVSENYAEGILDLITGRTRDTEQAVIILPASRDGRGIAGDEIRRLVRRAVGADIM